MDKRNWESIGNARTPVTSPMKKWSSKELRSCVKQGILEKCTKGNEHIALHPYWLDKPLQGIQEELDSRIGKWIHRLGGYLVSYTDLRRDTTGPSVIYDAQPWIHLDVRGKFHIFKPHEGQVLQGVIKTSGTLAAVCIVFNLFSVTVVPGTDFDVEHWTVGTELEFRITSYQKKPRGPQLSAKCMRIVASA